MLIALCLAPLLAAAQTPYGDWYVGRDDAGAPYMFTMNQSDGIFGKWCDNDTEKCFWMLAVKTRCDAGATIPVLISSNLGAASTTLICSSPKLISGATYHRMIIADFNLMTRLARESTGQIGIAMAMEGGAFRVSRFSLHGSSQALTQMEQAEADTVRAKRSKGTRDTEI
ncbi:hypothetical protein JJB11_11205 [Ramlibacter ginsenosidimutans]|uniref:Uncharacterized protein n=1 Tax=Ramlibacter ginsenosidimutans TaxID=502333 RepID=A0A934TSD3_9BURK|nr:hypothetical protein [Ramlibacter ginsenosidimutans]MBK6006659.1 hypothetical protein [Ramlibacter ginsenosidimutans]